MMNLHTVKLVFASIVEGPGEGLRGEMVLSVNVMAGSQQNAKEVVESALEHLLQAAVDGDIPRRGESGDT